MSGYHLDNDIIAGGAPIDCDHPLIVHIMANMTNIDELAIPAIPSQRPSRPIIILATAETIRPVAMNFFILQ